MSVAHGMRPLAEFSIEARSRIVGVLADIDYCEDVAPLPPAAVRAIVQRMEAAGMRARVSSIHVNGWFGDHHKLGTTRRLLAEEFGIVLETQAGPGRGALSGRGFSADP